MAKKTSKKTSKVSKSTKSAAITGQMDLAIDHADILRDLDIYMQLPTKLPPRKAITVEVDAALLNQVKAIAKKQGVTLRQVVEYGFKVYVEQHYIGKIPAIPMR
jgi:hypothetical protein